MVQKEIQWEIREYFELNENKNAYIILGEWKRIIALKTYIRKKKKDLKSMTTVCILRN